MPGAEGQVHDYLGLEPTFGMQHSLHRRRRAVDGQWESCTPSDPGHQPDSGVHRFSRVVGFTVGAEERQILETDALAAAAEASTRNRDRTVSHHEVVYRWSLFERYLLVHHPNTEYTRYIARLCMLASDEEEQMHHDVTNITFRAPPAVLLIAYAKMLRSRPGSAAQPQEHLRKGSYIRLLVLRTVSSVLGEFGWMPAAGESKPTADARLIDTIESFGDTKKNAVPFDMVDDLPKMHAAIFSMPGWDYLRQLQVWAMLLFSIAFMQRASDCTLHCASLEKMELPPVSEYSKGGWLITCC